MSTALCAEPTPGGFVFENSQRNAMLANKGLKLPKAYSTGTTIVGLVYKGESWRHSPGNGGQYIA